MLQATYWQLLRKVTLFGLVCLLSTSQKKTLRENLVENLVESCEISFVSDQNGNRDMISVMENLSAYKEMNGYVECFILLCILNISLLHR